MHRKEKKRMDEEHMKECLDMDTVQDMERWRQKLSSVKWPV